jgi:hypothetical protein
MRALNAKVLKALGLALVILLASGVAHAQTPAGTWQPLKNAPAFSPGTALVLTDGTLMVEDYGTGGGSQHWWRLTPDNTGSYVNGTWTARADMQSTYGPLYFASAVLDDGRVVVIGGEYNFGSQDWTKQGAIYTPKSNTWKVLNAPTGWSNVGDAQSAVLNIASPKFAFFLANPFNTQFAWLNPGSLAWTAVGTGKSDRNDEEGWELLPSGKILTVDALSAPNSELFNPATKAWTSAGNTPIQLEDPGSEEIGPAVLMTNGKVFATTGSPNFGGGNDIYDTATGTWVAGPSFPNIAGEGQYDIADGPASLMPNGNVLCVASPGVFNTPSRVFEYNPTANTLIEVPRPPGAVGDPSFGTRLLVLPNGQVLFDDGSSDVEIYTPSGTFNPAWQPVITIHPSIVKHGLSYPISGTQFNGLSQANAYGDDAQAASNYPLVRITNIQTQHVFYCRTHNHTSMGVATGALKVTTHFDVPATIELGPSTLVVVANGIPSASVSITVN